MTVIKAIHIEHGITKHALNFSTYLGEAQPPHFEGGGGGGGGGGYPQGPPPPLPTSMVVCTYQPFLNGGVYLIHLGIYALCDVFHGCEVILQCLTIVLYM